MLWVIRTADSVFLRDKGGEGLVAGESAVTVTRVPNARAERYDVGQASGIRAATGPEIATYDTSQVSSRSLATSRQKDVLATCALVVRSRDPNGWTAMTVQQKVNATQAEADIWKGMRDFIEDKTV